MPPRFLHSFFWRPVFLSFKLQRKRVVGKSEGRGGESRFFEKKVNGKVAFRGIGEIEGDPAKLVGVLENPARWKDWIDNFQSGRLLEKKTDYQGFLPVL